MPVVRLSTAAEKSRARLKRSDRRLFLRLERALDHLVAEPQAGKQLHGPLSALRSHRTGQLRIIYRYVAERQEVWILEIAHRREAYRP